MNVIAFHVQHDASVAISIDGELAVVLELERLFGERYFESSQDPERFEAQWRQAIDAVCEQVGTRRFDVAVTSWVAPSQVRILRTLVNATEWRKVSHHRAHALHGHYDSPFERSLVLSFDGGGNDGTFRVFSVNHGALNALETIRLNLGTPYRLLATTMPEVTGRRPQPRAGSLALSGKLMAYAALGRVREQWLDGLRAYFENYVEPLQALDSLSDDIGLELEADSLSEQDARDLAATSQEAFMRCLDRVADRYKEVPHDGLVLTGGCALNVVANQRLRERWHRPVHVPPAPNDAGIAVGALWDVARPRSRPSVFSGMPLVRDVTEQEFVARGGRQCSTRELASLLAAGAFVGVAQGRAEHGPRALGHRSILALAGGDEIRERINKEIKFREWYRPVAPVVRASDVLRYFDAPVEAPYMSFAPKLRADVARRFGAIAHVDGTARVQTVEPGSLLHSLLDDLASLGHEPLLVNTSFNIRGRPLIHRASEALDALDQTSLDFAWIEGWLIPKSSEHAQRFVAGNHR
jgi:carbamoyltransferase